MKAIFKYSYLMKSTSIFLGAIALMAILSPLAAAPAHALSCLPVDMYLKDVVGKQDEVTIFTGTVTDQIMEKEYTAEVLKVDTVKQGYAEDELFVYHEKSIDWGYLCNAGPAKKGDKSVYITLRDAKTGKYMVTQRLAMNDPLVATLDADLKKAEVEGNLGEITKTDRMNQIMTTINDIFKEIQILFKEYIYLKAQ
jgi:hypothetical protein